MGELGVNTIVGISSFVISSVFGAVVQRADFWTMGGISDPHADGGRKPVPVLVAGNRGGD